jgi:hypothetical protein
VADLQGVGSARAPLQSAATIKWQDEEGHSGFFTPYVLKYLPVNLWGRDALQGIGAILCSPNNMGSHMMFQQGFNPQRGLGKTQQGSLYPIDRDTPGALDWVTPLINLFRRGPG